MSLPRNSFSSGFWSSLIGGAMSQGGLMPPQPQAMSPWHIVPSAQPSITNPAGLQMPQLPPAISPELLEALKKAEPRRVLEKTPDYMEPIMGWRAWLVRNESPLVLRGVGRPVYAWEPKKRNEARCISGASAVTPINSFYGVSDTHYPCNDPPRKHCFCGFWGFKAMEDLLAVVSEFGDLRVFGRVYLWGRMQDCKLGYRAQYAYPAELWLVDPSLEELGRIYNVPIRTAG